MAIRKFHTKSQIFKCRQKRAANALIQRHTTAFSSSRNSVPRALQQVEIAVFHFCKELAQLFSRVLTVSVQASDKRSARSQAFGKPFFDNGSVTAILFKLKILEARIFRTFRVLSATRYKALKRLRRSIT